MAKTKNTSPKVTKKNKTRDVKIHKKVQQNCVTYTCRYDDCKKTFTNANNRLVHEKLHLDESFPCPLCPYVGKTKKYLSAHKRKKHAEVKKHKCKVCGKSFHYPSALKQHVMVHTGEKPYQCSFCEKSFRVSYSLNCHMLIHTNEKPHQCVFCDYSCRDSSTLRKHQNRHMGMSKTYPCKICPKEFTEMARLKYHISHVHLAHLDIIPKRHQCKICNKTFGRKSMMERHIQAVHERTLSCKCPICDKHITNRYNLAGHLTLHFNERPFACTYEGCTAKFKDKGTLKRHTVTHYPRLQHACTICNKTFARALRRDAHMVVHRVRDKTVQCDYCGVKFYTKNYLIKHIKSKHCAEKQRKKYICDHCNLKTYNKPSIVMHLKHGHCAVIPTSLKCKYKTCQHKKYKRYEYLKNHYLRTHNIRFKPMKKCKRKKRTPSIQVKVEPIDEEQEEIQLLEIDKVEQDDSTDDEYIDYSKHVLSEDLSQYMLDDEASDSNFDKFLRRHVFNDTVKHYDDDPILRVDEEKRNTVTEKVKKLLQRTKTEEQRKRIIKQQIREEKMKRKRKKQEITELRKVREFYNKRMKEAAESQKEPQKKITYFKNKSVNDDDKAINDDDKAINDNDKSINDNNKQVTESNDFNNESQKDNSDDNSKNVRLRKANDKIVSYEETDDENHSNEENSNDVDYEPTTAKNGKLIFKTHQCYVCFKLFPTKEDLNEHRKESHKITDQKKANVKSIDKRNRELKDKAVFKTKLVKKGDEWRLERVVVKIEFVEMPEFTLNELRNLRVTDNYVDRLGQLNQLAKTKGIKIMFPCDKCDKICQNFSAIKLHSRRHDPNKKPFKPKKWRHKGQTPDVKKTPEIDITKRSAKPAPIIHKHKCDDKLKEFYETHVRGANIEFWQFLKIYNKMERENINDFKDLEGRTDFGIHNYDEIRQADAQNCNESESYRDELANNGKEKRLADNRKEKKLANNKKEKRLAKNNRKKKFAGESGNVKRKLANEFLNKQIYKRTILISKRQYLEREAMKIGLRDKIAKNN